MKKLLAMFVMVTGIFSSLCADTEYTADFSNSVIQKSENVTNVNAGEGARYNSHYKHSWILPVRGKSYVEMIFNKPKEIKGIATLNLNHLSSIAGGVTFSPVNITINDKLLMKYNPNIGYYIDDTFYIGLKDGENKIKITLDDSADTCYWISKLKVRIFN